MLDRKAIELINSILIKGERVEIVPTRDGVRVYRIVRREMK